jgi:uncharacterized protein YjbI with pentapeptide repeats
MADDGSQQRKPDFRTAVEDVKALATLLVMKLESVLGRRLYSDLITRDRRVVDLTGADFTRAYLGKASLSKADLSGAILSEAYMSEAVLEHADLSLANLSSAEKRPKGRCGLRPLEPMGRPPALRNGSQNELRGNPNMRTSVGPKSDR